MNYPRNKYRIIDGLMRRILLLVRLATVTGLYAGAILVGALYLAQLVQELKLHGF